jgi:HPt (histidine-containing phosphotransfer) domain-containing protein
MLKPRTPPADQLAAAMVDIRARFVDGLIPLINEMEYQRLAMDDPSRAAAAVASLQQASHRISGMAGSVGFAELGASAGALDIAFTQLRRRAYDPAGVAALQGPLEDFLAMIEDVLDSNL